MTDMHIVFHVSDVHFGVADPAAHRWFAQAVAAERPDAVLCTGDITQRAKHREYRAAHNWFAGLGVPVMMEPGNHDMPYYNPAERFLTPFKRFNRLNRAVGTWLDLPHAAFITLRTTVRAQKRFPWSDGYVKPAALGRALRQLQALRDDPRQKLVVCHHPLMAGAPGSPNPTIHGDEAFAALARAGADVVLSGHVHNPFDLTYEAGGRPLRMIGAGTLSTRIRSAPPSFNVLRLGAGGVLDLETRYLES